MNDKLEAFTNQLRAMNTQLSRSTSLNNKLVRATVSSITKKILADLRREV